MDNKFFLSGKISHEEIQDTIAGSTLHRFSNDSIQHMTKFDERIQISIIVFHHPNKCICCSIPTDTFIKFDLKGKST